MAAPDNDTQHCDDDQPSRVIKHVAPLLIRDCLAAPERLSLFKTSRAAAEAVLQSSPSTSLLPAAPSAQQRTTAMHLACQAAPRIKLVLSDYLTTTPEPLWQRITVLILYGMELSVRRFQNFRQPTAPQHLHTLRLKRCTLLPSGSDGGSSSSSGGSGMDGMLAVRTLECIQCKPERSYLGHALALMDKGQLQELITDGEHDSTVLQDMPPQLQRLSLFGAPIGDQSLEQLLASPTITHLTAAVLLLFRDHSTKQPTRLQEIVLLRTCRIAWLANIPLAHLRSCTLMRDLELYHEHNDRDGKTVGAAVDKIMPHKDKVICKPSPRSDQWDEEQPVFQLSISDSADISMMQLRQAVTLCTPHLQGALILRWATYRVLMALAVALPASITTLVLYEVDDSLKAMLMVTETFINLLPPHVNHLVLSTCFLTLDHIRQVVTGVARPIKITFHSISHGPGWHGWEVDEMPVAQFEAQVRAWLAAYPNQVQVEVVRQERRLYSKYLKL